MPKELKPEVLYVSEEFNSSAHLCPCGCGFKIRTPLGPTGWTFKETASGPTLSPSVGNWQLPCKSHYLIYRGNIIWCSTWSPEQIALGRRHEEKNRQAYYNAAPPQKEGGLGKLWRMIKGLL